MGLGTIPYFGWRINCYAVSLACILESRDLKLSLPILDCVTTLPFGPFFYTNDGRRFFAVTGIDPERGIERALDTLGFSSRHSHFTSAEEALQSLKSTLSNDLVLVGPVDMGYLSYDPFCRYKMGADHYIVAFEVKNDYVIVDDPQGYVRVPLPLKDFIEAWKAENIHYKKGPFSMREVRGRIRELDVEDVYGQTLRLGLKNQMEDTRLRNTYIGSSAIMRLSEDVRKPRSSDLLRHLSLFSLPVANQRCFDCSFFINSAPFTNKYLSEASMKRMQQALLYGYARLFAVKKQVGKLSKALVKIASFEDEFRDNLKMGVQSLNSRLI